MFFLFSKILDFFISPITWIVVLLAITVFTKNAIRKRKTLIITFVSVLFFSNPLILALFGNLIPTCENVIIQETKAKFHAAILLGGMISYDESNDRILFNANINRLTQTVELYKKGMVKKILITGGSGSIIYPKKREANLLKNYLITYFKLSEKDIFIENKSNNTYENALFSKKILDSLGWNNQRLILITSPLHQYRAQACFAKQGYKTFVYSPRRKKHRLEKVLPKNLFLPQAEILLEWNNFLHELIGVITYKVARYI